MQSPATPSIEPVISEELLEVHKEIGDFMLKTMQEMKKIWDDIGISKAQCTERLATFSHHVKMLVTEMKEEDVERKECLLSNIETCSEKLHIICTELGLPPYEAPDDLTIIHLEKNIRTKLEECMTERTDRLDALKKLKDKLHELTTRLCTEMHVLPFKLGEVPTMKQLQELEGHVCIMEAEKDKRLTEYKMRRENICQYFNQLQKNVSTPFQKAILAEPELFLLSSDNMDCIKKLEEELYLQIKKNELEAVELREKISLLWTRLQMDVAALGEFLTNHSGHSPNTLKALCEELLRCEELKRQNIQKFIEEMRSELRIWWKKCLISEEEKNLFRAFYNDSHTEDILELHELEVQKLKLYYEENVRIFDTIAKWEQMWSKMLELEERANDPNRFMNRGGSLIQEEKERREVNEKLPELEKKLQKYISEWEAKNDSKFHINGLEYVEFIDTHKRLHEQQKENRILERKKAKAKLLEQELLGACKQITPSKWPMPGSAKKTPNKIKVINKTPGSNSKIYSKTPLMRLTEKKRRSLKGLKRLSKGHSNTKTKPLVERNEDNNFSQSTIAGNVLQKQTGVCNAGSYKEFAKRINMKAMDDDCCSTVITPVKILPTRSPRKKPLPILL